jgi:meso-butanediol dehydrogenase / (S,S)-butanediol dehydrogenase / diacetyl reductase
MLLGIKDKVVIVTGGARGIGAAIVRSFVEEEANVVLGDITIDETWGFVDELGRSGSRVLPIRIDITKQSDVENLVSTAMGMHGKIDILVNNAGVCHNVTFLDISEEEWDQVNSVNAKGTYLVTKAVLPHMISAKQGKIVNIASVAGKEGFEGHAHYCASKFAVIGLTQALAKEVAGHNINVNAVCPGILRTQMWEGMLDTLTLRENRPKDEILNSWVDRLIPLKRLQTPQDIANAVLFLSSDVSKNMTGQSVCVDGGIRMD